MRPRSLPWMSAIYLTYLTCAVDCACARARPHAELAEPARASAPSQALSSAPSYAPSSVSRVAAESAPAQSDDKAKFRREDWIAVGQWDSRSPDPD